MERNKSIIYIGTEDNAKSCLGLEEILKDGWNVKMTIAYKPKAPNKPKDKIKGIVKKNIFFLIKYLPFINIFSYKKIYKDIPSFKTMKTICGTYNIAYVLTSDKTLARLEADIAKVSPDIILSNGWQFKITNNISSRARLIVLNCHSSYLPEYRGGNVTYAPLINEEKQSGVTVHELVDKFDAGLILAQERISLEPNETPYSLNIKRATITGKLLIQALEVAGHTELYKPNPPSPFYFRCNYSTYKRYKRLNFFRKLIGLPIKRYNPRHRYDI